MQRALALGVVLAVALTLWVARFEETRPTPIGPRDGAVTGLVRAGAAPLAGRGGQRRRAAPDGPAPTAVEPVSVPEEPERPVRRSWLVQGRVIDPSGRPVSGVEVTGGDEPGAARSASRTDERGRFRLRAAERGQQVSIVSPGLATLARRAVQSGFQELIVAPASGVRGLVVDDRGAPLGGVRVESDPLPEALSALAETSDGWKLLDWSTTSEADGTFTFRRLPTGVTGRMHFALAGFASRDLDWSATRAGELLVELTPEPTFIGLEGRVVYPGGGAVRGAKVRFGTSHTLADERGAFRLELSVVHAEQELVAAHSSGGLARTAGLGAQLLASGTRSHHVELVLEEPEGVVAGFLEDASGQPLAGWIVSVVVPGEDRTLACPPDGVRRSLAVCETDARGTFRVRGRFESETLRLRAWGKQAGITALSDPVEVGCVDFRWVLSAAPGRGAVASQVVDTDGAPVAGARITLRPVLECDEGTLEGALADAALSGPEGEFQLLQFDRGLQRLEITARGFAPRTIETTSGEILPQVIVLARTCDIAISVSAGDAKGCVVELRDRFDQPLMARPAFDDGSALLRVPLSDAPIRVCTSEDVVHLVVLDGGEEVFRRTVSPKPGELVRVRL